MVSSRQRLLVCLTIAVLLLSAVGLPESYSLVDDQLNLCGKAIKGSKSTTYKVASLVSLRDCLESGLICPGDTVELGGGVHYLQDASREKDHIVRISVKTCESDVESPIVIRGVTGGEPVIISGELQTGPLAFRELDEFRLASDPIRGTPRRRVIGLTSHAEQLLRREMGNSVMYQAAPVTRPGASWVSRFDVANPSSTFNVLSKSPGLFGTVQVQRKGSLSERVMINPYASADFLATRSGITPTVIKTDSGPQAVSEEYYAGPGFLMDPLADCSAWTPEAADATPHNLVVGKGLSGCRTYFRLDADRLPGDEWNPKSSGVFPAEEFPGTSEQLKTIRFFPMRSGISLGLVATQTRSIPGLVFSNITFQDMGKVFIRTNTRRTSMHTVTLQQVQFLRTRLTVVADTHAGEEGKLSKLAIQNSILDGGVHRLAYQSDIKSVPLLSQFEVKDNQGVFRPHGFWAANTGLFPTFSEWDGIQIRSNVKDVFLSHVTIKGYMNASILGDFVRNDEQVYVAPNSFTLENSVVENIHSEALSVAVQKGITLSRNRFTNVAGIMNIFNRGRKLLDLQLSENLFDPQGLTSDGLVVSSRPYLSANGDRLLPPTQSGAPIPRSVTETEAWLAALSRPAIERDRRFTFLTCQHGCQWQFTGKMALVSNTIILRYENLSRSIKVSGENSGTFSTFPSIMKVSATPLNLGFTAWPTQLDLLGNLIIKGGDGPFVRHAQLTEVAVGRNFYVQLRNFSDGRKVHGSLFSPIRLLLCSNGDVLGAPCPGGDTKGFALPPLTTDPKYFSPTPTLENWGEITKSIPDRDLSPFAVLSPSDVLSSNVASPVKIKVLQGAPQLR